MPRPSTSGPSAAFITVAAGCQNRSVTLASSAIESAIRQGTFSAAELAKPPKEADKLHMEAEAGASPKPPRRSLLICAEDTAASAAAAQWVLDHIYREGDVIHLTYVVTCLMQPMEVFHGLPGTAYSFSPPGVHREQEMISDAKKRLEERFLPMLRPHLVPYQLHLFAERTDATPQRVAEVIQEEIDKQQPALVVVAAHNKPGTQEGLGSVAEHLSNNLKIPLAIVHT